jgi:predicted DNA binding CopG/RHH family protein
MLSDRIKARLRKDMPMTSITIRMPVDAIESIKAIAPIKGLIGYQSLPKSCVSESLRRD